MTSMWSTQSVASRINPDALHTQLANRLAQLELLMQRLTVCESEVSSRDMVECDAHPACSAACYATLSAARAR